jgi:hypothetical protein
MLTKIFYGWIQEKNSKKQNEYRTFRAASFLINSKRGRQIFLEVMKAYG